MKKIKHILKRRVAPLMLCIIMVTMVSIPAYATTQSISTTWNPQGFDKPKVGFNDFGWVIYDVYVKYTENYTSSSNTNTFTSRDVVYTVDGSRDPGVDHYISPFLCHYLSNDTKYGTYILGPGDPAWFGDHLACGSLKNTDSVSHSKTTTNYGAVGFSIASRDVVRAYSHQINLSLTTR